MRDDNTKRKLNVRKARPVVLLVKDKGAPVLVPAQ